MRRQLVVGNWKMNTMLSDAIILATGIRNTSGNYSGIEIVLCPPFVWLYPLAEILEKSPANISLGAQNLHWAEEGAFTGEVSAKMLKKLCSYVIIGHSERRKFMGDNQEIVNEKVIQALKQNLKPILCVGEDKKMSENLIYSNEIDPKTMTIEQLRSGLDNIKRDDIDKIVIAYEPVWAIGTGHAATGAYAVAVIDKLRQVLAKKYGRQVADEMRILYGGSVDSKNIAEYVLQPAIDGVLVGGASLKLGEFSKICQTVSSYKET